MPWTTRQAAEASGMTPAAFRQAAYVARQAGIELRCDPTTWLDARTPVYDVRRTRDYLARRPGKGVGGGRPKTTRESP